MEGEDEHAHRAGMPHSETHEHHVHQDEKPHPSKGGGGIAARLLGYKIPLLATLVYFILALIIFYPAAAHPGSVVIGSGGDIYQNLWFLWWAKYAVLNLHTNVFHTDLLFWPIGAGLAYQTMAPLLGLLSAPLQLLGVPFAYNVVFFMGFALSGLGMYILADYLVKDSRAAFIAGIIFAFSAFHIAQSSHIHFINIEWAPLFAYFLLRAVRERHNYWNIVGMAAMFALSTLASNIEVSLIIIWILPIVIIYELATREGRKEVVSRWFLVVLILFGLLAFAFGSWNYIPIIHALTQNGGVSSANYLNSAQYNTMWSTNILAFFLPGYYNGIAYVAGLSTSLYNSGVYSPDPSERQGYIGYSVLLLVIYGVYKTRKNAALWLFGALVFGWLAVGPAGGLYSVYHALPYLNVIREPGRFQLLFTMCMAVMAAFGFAELSKRFASIGKNDGLNVYGLALTAVVSIIVLTELAGIPMGSSLIGQMTTKISVPLAYQQLRELGGNFSVLTLPALAVPGNTPALYTGSATYYTSVDREPLVGGYLGGRENSTQDLLIYQIPLAIEATSLLDYDEMLYQSPVVENYTDQTLLTLYNYDTAFVVLDKTAYNQSQFDTIGGYLYSVFGAPLYDDNTTIIFSTQNAIGNSAYRSYVAYPSLTDWNQTVSFVNGGYLDEWMPAGAGTISVFAPYTNSADIYNSLYHNEAYYINSTITVFAASASPQRLYLGVPTSATNYSTIGYANLTSQFSKYTFSVPMISGPEGNTFFFISQDPSYPVRILNISFSREG